MYNNEELNNLQDIKLGVTVHDEHVAANGKANDVVCLSQELKFLKNIETLCMHYLKKYHVTLVADKTKVFALYSKKQRMTVEYQKLLTTLSINGTGVRKLNM